MKSFFQILDQSSRSRSRFFFSFPIRKTFEILDDLDLLMLNFVMNHNLSSIVFLYPPPTPFT